MIIAHALTEATVDDATTAIELIQTVDGHIASVTGDAAYDSIAWLRFTHQRRYLLTHSGSNEIEGIVTHDLVTLTVPTSPLPPTAAWTAATSRHDDSAAHTVSGHLQLWLIQSSSCPAGTLDRSDVTDSTPMTSGQFFS